MLLLLAVFSRGTAYADGISGFLEFTESLSDTTSKITGQETSKSSTASFIQRYGLALNRSLYPYLKLTAGGIFDRSMTDTSTDSIDVESKTTQISPYINLSLGNPFVSSAIGYNRNESSSSGTGSPSQTSVLETYTARLGLRPEEMPSLDLRFTRTNSFDKDKVRFDTTSDSYSLGSNYQPLQNLYLTYNGAIFETSDRLNSLNNQTITQSATSTYNEQFFANRVSIFTSGTLSSQETTVSSGVQGGIVVLPVFPGPSRGLFATTTLTTPVTVTNGLLTDTPALLNGTARINIVTPFTTPLPTDGREINLGLEFAQETVVNTLFLTVVSGTNTENIIGSAIPALFTWDIYTSVDGINWNLAQTISNATFDRNPFSPSSNTVGFILPLTVPATRFIKAAVAPPHLPSSPPFGVDRDSIVVTRIDALQSIAVEANQKLKNSTLNGIMTVGARVKLLDRPSLPAVNFDTNLNYTFNRPSAGATTTNLFITNGLSAYQTFNRYLSAAARLSREDSDSDDGQTSANSYSASLNFRPLSTLTHSLTYSGRSQSFSGKSSSSNSFFLSNFAELYRGLSFRLSGGVSLNSNEDGSDSQSTILTSGVAVNPHPTLSMNISYSESHAKTSGGGRIGSSSTSRSGELTTSYTPLSSLSLFATLGFSAQSSRDTITTQSFGGNWSPFRDGAIIANITYIESLNSVGDEKTRILSPSLQWNIRQGWQFNVTYSLLATKQFTAGLTNEFDQSNITMGLRISF
jgi:hypothetical protein